ncbi:MAG: hypothetical protein IPL17_18125 [Anaerolineales bacterium]|nr:hypothetical protein [Anaerolineales bacterium]
MWGESGTGLYVNGVQDSHSPDNLYPALNSLSTLLKPIGVIRALATIDDLRITSSAQTNFGVSALAERIDHL